MPFYLRASKIAYYFLLFAHLTHSRYFKYLCRVCTLAEKGKRELLDSDRVFDPSSKTLLVASTSYLLTLNVNPVYSGTAYAIHCTNVREQCFKLRESMLKTVHLVKYCTKYGVQIHPIVYFTLDGGLPIFPRSLPGRG